MFNFDKNLKTSDPEIYNNIHEELQRQQTHIELIASENYTSPSVLAAQGSVLTNKYAEGYVAKRFYNGCEFIDNIESLAIERAKQLFKADFANVQPHSGSSANAAAYLALCQPGDTILGMSLSHGGHLTHGAKPNFSGRIYNAVHYGRTASGEDIDYDQVAKLAREHCPKLIIAGFSSFSGVIDWKFFRDIADEVGAYFLADMAHVSGLIAAGLYPSPVPYADVVTTTTHKTLRGPRSGLIVARDNPEIHKKLQSAIFPGYQGGPLCHVIAAKAVAFKEALEPSFIDYQKNVIANAKAMVATFQNLNCKVVGNGTENHMFSLDLSDRNYSGHVASTVLEQANITLNKNAIPNDPRPPTQTSGLRLGTPAITTRGFNQQDCEQVAHYIVDVLNAIETDNEHKVVAEVKDKLAVICQKRPVYSDFT